MTPIPPLAPPIIAWSGFFPSLRFPNEQEVFGLMTVVFVILILVALTKPAIFMFLRDKGTEFPSLQRQGQYVALITMTWGFMFQVSKDRLSTEYATFYALIFVGSQAVSIFQKINAAKNQQNSPPAPTPPQTPTNSAGG